MLDVIQGDAAEIDETSTRVLQRHAPSLLVLLTMGKGRPSYGRHKKAPTWGDWGQYRSLPTFLSKVASARKSGRFPGLRLRPTLCTFPREEPSVVSADFVPLTVAGPRWLCTSFPAHSKSC